MIRIVMNDTILLEINEEFEWISTELLTMTDIRNLLDMLKQLNEAT